MHVRHAPVVGDPAVPDPHRIDGVERDHPAGGAVVASVDLVILFIPTGSAAEYESAAADLVDGTALQRRYRPADSNRPSGIKASAADRPTFVGEVSFCVVEPKTGT